MRRRQAIHVVDLAIGGAAAMEQLAIPGGAADAVVGWVLARRVNEPLDLIGLADLIIAPAFRHGLTEGNNALAERLSVAAPAATAEAERNSRAKQKRRGKPAQAYATNAPGPFRHRLTDPKQRAYPPTRSLERRAHRLPWPARTGTGLPSPDSRLKSLSKR